MTEENYIPNPAEQFILDRMREFPTLYPHAHAVIADVVFNGVGSPEWTADGLIVCTDKQYNSKTKSFEPYTKVIDESVARSMYLKYFNRFPSYPKSINSWSLINKIPDNADDSWLKIIDSYLFHFRAYDEKAIMLIAQAKTFIQHNVYENKYAGEPQRTIHDLTDFVKRIPSWQAKIRAIEYVKANGFIEPETYMGIDI